MAGLVQPGLSTGSGRMQWALEQRFPKPSKSFSRGILDNLNHLQSVSPDVACVIYCGDILLGAPDNGNFGVFFRMEPSPLQSRFVLELRFGPSTKRTVIAASFSAYDDQNGTLQLHRTPHIWVGTHGNVVPRGPIDFSRQLYQVMYRTGADAPEAPVTFRDVDPAVQLNFSWLSNTCARYGFGYPRAGLPQDVIQAVDRFKAILDQATTRNVRLGVVIKKSVYVPLIYWPWFCCQPSPSPHSWFPWLNPLNASDPCAIMDFSTSNFGLDPTYISKALGLRQGDWFTSGDELQNVNTIPQPLLIAKLKAVYRFTDHREYLVHVLGSHAYEHANHTDNIRSIRQNVIQVMTGGDSFWKSWLLAQDNYSLDNTAGTDDLPTDWQQRVNAAIHRSRLDPEQAQAVRHYLQHKVTIVVGAPGTGKSRLVDVIMKLEKLFKCQSHGIAILDASQNHEACAIHPILHAHVSGDLRRVLLIGDRNRLPPTLKAPRNPFSATGSVSLMERQILTGMPYIQLRTQYRA